MSTNVYLVSWLTFVHTWLTLKYPPQPKYYNSIELSNIESDLGRGTSEYTLVESTESGWGAPSHVSLDGKPM